VKNLPEPPTLTVLAIQREPNFGQLMATVQLPMFPVPIIAAMSIEVAGMLRKHDHSEIHWALIENSSGLQANMLLSGSEISGLTAFPVGNQTQITKSAPVRLVASDQVFNEPQKEPSRVIQ